MVEAVEHRPAGRLHRSARSCARPARKVKRRGRELCAPARGRSAYHARQSRFKGACAMGPFPHDAPPASISAENPAGTDGFEFVEFAHPEPEKLARALRPHGLRAGRAGTGRKAITLWRQGDITYVLNAEPGSFGPRLRRGARALRAVDGLAGGRCRARASATRSPTAPRPYSGARQGAGRAGDRRHRRQPDLLRRQPTARRAAPTTPSTTGSASPTRSPKGVGFYYLDHLTHNVHRGNMDTWFGFYGEHLQLPPDPLLRHRGQVHRPALAAR